jgi:hypothetical protein
MNILRAIPLAQVMVWKYLARVKCKSGNSSY